MQRFDEGWTKKNLLTSLRMVHPYQHLLMSYLKIDQVKLSLIISIEWLSRQIQMTFQ